MLAQRIGRALAGRQIVARYGHLLGADAVVELQRELADRQQPFRSAGDRRRSAARQLEHHHDLRPGRQDGAVRCQRIGIDAAFRIALRPIGDEHRVGGAHVAERHIVGFRQNAARHSDRDPPVIDMGQPVEAKQPAGRGDIAAQDGFLERGFVKGRVGHAFLVL